MKRKQKSNEKEIIPTRSDNQTLESEQQERNHPPPYIVLPSAKEVNLTNGHLGLFKKGPNFIPTTFKVDRQEFLNDISKWCNTLRWAYFHSYCKSPIIEDQVLQPVLQESEQINFYQIERFIMNQ